VSEAITMNDYIVKTIKRFFASPGLFLALQFPLFINLILLYALSGWLDRRPVFHALVSMSLYGIAWTFSAGMTFTVLRERGDRFSQCLAAVRPRAAELARIGVVVQLATLAGLVAFLLPGLYVAVACSFVPWIVMTSEPQPLRSLFERSRELVKERGFIYYAILLVTFMILTVSIGFALSFVAKEVGMPDKSFVLQLFDTTVGAVMASWMQIILSYLFLHRPQAAA